MICARVVVNADCQAPMLVVGKRIVVASPEGMPFGTRTRMTMHASDDMQGHFSPPKEPGDLSNASGEDSGEAEPGNDTDSDVRKSAAASLPGAPTADSHGVTFDLDQRSSEDNTRLRA